MTAVLVQMHGLPGTGKTTLARALGRELPAIVIDKDVISSALIREGVSFGESGPLAYQVMYAQAERFLEDGQSVVFDSPCFWPMIEENTRRIAAKSGGRWTMIETVCAPEIRDARLASRVGLESNPTTLSPRRDGMYDPSCERLVVDTALPPAECLALARQYLSRESAVRP